MHLQECARTRDQPPARTSEFQAPTVSPTPSDAGLRACTCREARWPPRRIATMPLRGTKFQLEDAISLLASILQQRVGLDGAKAGQVGDQVGDLPHGVASSPA